MQAYRVLIKIKIFHYIANVPAFTGVPNFVDICEFQILGAYTDKPLVQIKNGFARQQKFTRLKAEMPHPVSTCLTYAFS